MNLGTYLMYAFHLYLKYILKDNAHNFGKGDKFMAIFKDLLGDGIFNSNGPNWELQRKIAAKIFTGF
jgi:fatty acid omega-hydroxylase